MIDFGLGSSNMRLGGLEQHSMRAGFTLFPCNEFLFFILDDFIPRTGGERKAKVACTAIIFWPSSFIDFAFFSLRLRASLKVQHFLWFNSRIALCYLRWCCRANYHPAFSIHAADNETRNFCHCIQFLLIVTNFQVVFVCTVSQVYSKANKM
jgi:hypothetical protein